LPALGTEKFESTGYIMKARRHRQESEIGGANYTWPGGLETAAPPERINVNGAYDLLMGALLEVLAFVLPAIPDFPDRDSFIG
jgi:hypothetical protein